MKRVAPEAYVSNKSRTKCNHEAHLDEAGCDAGAGGDHGLETAVVHHEVTHCNTQHNHH
jgi:hypothetical protein